MAAKVAPRGAVTRTTAFGLAALVLAAVLAGWGLSAYRKAQLQKSVAVLVRDSSERLQAALALEANAASASSAQTVSALDEHAQEVDKHVIELHDVSSEGALAAAAEEYLLTVRQILRQQAASHRYRMQVSAAEGAL